MFDAKKVAKFLKENFSLKDIFIILSILAIFFITRLYNLEKLPIFGDEGIYIRWAKTAWRDANWRFISLTDGRQPLQTWATIPFLKLFPEKPLFAGRLFGVASGFLSLIGVFVLSFYLFGKRAAYISSLIYTFTPYFLFYDRMALADSMVNAGFIWLFFFSILLWKTLRLDVSLITGLAAGIFLLAKSSLRLALINSIFAPVLSYNKLFAKPRRLFEKSLNYYILLLFSLFLSFIIYNIQRLSPFFHFVAQKNLTFVMSFEEFKRNPFAFFPHNVKLIPSYIFSETTWIFLIFVTLGFVKLFKKNKGLFLYLLIWIIIPLTAISFFAKVLFPRYLLFIGGLLIIPASYFLYQLPILSTKSQAPITKQTPNPKSHPEPEQSSVRGAPYRTEGSGTGQIPNLVIILVFLYQAFVFDRAILFSPKDIPFPPVDRGQYIEGITAGWGLKEILGFAREKAKEKPVILIAEGDFGVVGDQLEALKKLSDTNISIKGYWPLDEKALLEHQKDLSDKYVFVVFSHNQNPPKEWPIKLIKKFPKPNSDKAIYLYELVR